MLVEKNEGSIKAHKVSYVSGSFGQRYEEVAYSLMLLQRLQCKEL